MHDQPPGERPGHLDVDAVSAYIDRDLHPDDLSTVELHLAACPACQREVLEIHTTVVLLTALPQYAPRRSFCLGREYARAARRSRTALPWPAIGAGQGSPMPAASVIASRFGGGFAGLHAAALVVGALLLLVASSDFLGIPPQPAAWLGGEGEHVATYQSAPPPAPVEEPMARVASAPNARAMVTATAFASEAAFATLAEQEDGTTRADGASQGLSAIGDEAPQAPRSAATSIAAAMPAQPTAAAGLGPTAAGEAPERAGVVAERPPQRSVEPSQLRLAEIALAFGLAWLIVTIVGLRWVRRVR